MLSELLFETIQHWFLAALGCLLTLWFGVRVYRIVRNPEGVKIMLAVITAASALSVAAFFGSLHYAKVARIGSKSNLTTDQVLAALSTNITILGGIVGVAAIGVGVGALFGYAELRTATMRKTEDHLVKLIRAMQTRGELTDATAAVLLESVVPERVIVLRVPTQESNAVSAASNNRGSESGESQIALEYPEDMNDSPEK